MKQVGFVISLVAVIIDIVLSGLVGLTLLSINGGFILGLLTLGVLTLEIIAIIQFKKSKGWIIFLLVLGIIVFLNQVTNKTLPILSIMLIIGSILGLQKDQKQEL